MKKINFKNLKNKQMWADFLKTQENKILIVIMFTVFVYWLISGLIPNMWVKILVYYLIYIGLTKLYDIVYKNFFDKVRK